MDVYRRTLCTLALGFAVAAAPACKKKTDTAAAAPDSSMAAPAPAATPFAVLGVEVW